MDAHNNTITTSDYTDDTKDKSTVNFSQTTLSQLQCQQHQHQLNHQQHRQQHHHHQHQLQLQLQLQQQQQQQLFRQPPQKQQQQQKQKQPHMTNLKTPQRTRRSKKKIKAQKFCVVCGDKAIACNFNATTCESCKAFFRRNAFKENLKCVFDDQCVIDRVTRRFCSSCRLKKCFKNGMLKEWILSDEQKQLKRDKIIDNKRIRSQLSCNNSGNESESTYDGTPSESIITKLEHYTNKDFSNILLTVSTSSTSTTPTTTTTTAATINDNTTLLYNNERDVKPCSATLLEANNITAPYYSNYCVTDVPSHTQTIPYHMGDINNNGCTTDANNINHSNSSDFYTFGGAPMASEQHHHPHQQPVTSCSNVNMVQNDHPISCVRSQACDGTADHSSPGSSYWTNNTVPSTADITSMPLVDKQLVRLSPNSYQSIYRDYNDDSVIYSPIPKSLARTPEELYNPEIALNPIVLCTDVKKLSGEWQEWETTLLNQLSESSNLLFMPIGEKFKVQTVREMIAQTDYLLARLVKCMKKLSSFTTLLADDQVQILKSKCLSVLLLRSANVFEAMNESWNDADGNPNNKLALDWLKNQPRTETLYNANRQFLMNFQEGLRYDKMIMILLAAILIFDTDSSKIHDRNALALRKARHIYLLMRYLHRNTNDPLGIRHCLMTIVLGMQNTVDSYLDFMHRETPSKEVYPLLCEFFDI